MKMAFFVLFASTMLSASVFAGNDGHGGHGITYRNQLYLFDFFEAGIEGQEYVSTNINNEMGIGPELRNHILAGDPSVIDLVIDKLNEIYQMAPEFAIELHRDLLNYEWRFLTPELFKVYDVGFTPILLSGNLPTVSLAVRDDDSKIVFVDKVRWAQLTVRNRAGLIFHEILYALYVARTRLDPFLVIDSYHARIFNGFLFHPSFQNADHEHFMARLKILAGPADYLSYADYTRIKSATYQQDCQQLKSESISRLTEYLERMSASINRLIQFRINAGVSYYYTRLGTQSISLYGVNYSLPSNNSKTCVNCGYDDRFELMNDSYRFPDADAASLIDGISFAQQTLNQEKDQFLNHCLSTGEPELAKVLKTLISVNVFDNRTK